MNVSILSNLSRRWITGWVIWPLVAYWVSCATWVGLIVFFPILLTVAQWQSLKRHPDNEHPSYWLMLLPIYAILLYETPAMNTLPHDPIGYSGAVLKFYISQCLAELLLSRMFAGWKFGWYTLANVVACFLWQWHFRMDVANVTNGLWAFGLIPALAVVTNLITGLGLWKATQPN